MSIASRLVRLYDHARQRLNTRRLAPATENEKLLAGELRDRLRQLTVEIDSSMPASEQAWRRNMLRLKELATQADPRDFLGWDVVCGTMFVKYAKYSRGEYGYLRQQPDWMRWRAALAESRIGNPPPCPFDATTSCNLVHHAYHVAQFEQVMHDHVDKYGFVLEFGGGYGSMCRLLHNLGFKGRYLIIDLPAFSRLQEYYLKSIGLDVLTEAEYLSGKAGVLCLSDIESIEKFVDREARSLFIATWSISESPMAVRSGVLKAADTMDAYLIAFQPAFEDMDNVQFFDQWKERKKDYIWKMQDIRYQPRQRYLFGVKSG